MEYTKQMLIFTDISNMKVYVDFKRGEIISNSRKTECKIGVSCP